MKLILLVSCLVAGTMAGPPLSRAGVQYDKITDAVMDWSSTANNAQRQAAQSSKAGRNAADFDKSATNQAAKDQMTGSDYGSRSTGGDKASDAASRAQEQASSSGYAANRWADSADARRASKDNAWDEGSQFYQGRRNNDDINYAYDKSFDLRDSSNGGFEMAESSDSHALDDNLDRAASFDRTVDKDSAWASAADAARANEKSASGQNAASSGSSWDKFFKDSSSAASANGRDKDWANKIDQSQGANREWSDARKAASDVYKDLATKDGSYKRKSADVGAKEGYVVPKSTYGYGVAGVGGYAAKPAFYASPVLGKALADDASSASNSAGRSTLKNSDSRATSDQSKADSSRDQWLSDQSRGFDRDSKKSGSDKGANDWARQAAQSANKADSSAEDSANAWKKDQGKDLFDENISKKQAEQRKVSDRAQNKKAYRKEFSNKRQGGDNKERMTYDLDQSDDAFGYKKANKKDWANAASANQWNSRQDANGKNAQSSNAAYDAKNAKQADSSKAAAGWQNAKAAAKSSDEAKRNGAKNEAWKDDQASNAQDARAQNAQKWDRDAARANAASVGSYSNSALPKSVLNYPAYPAQGYAAFPAQGYAAFPAKGYAAVPAKGYAAYPAKAFPAKGYAFPAAGFNGYGFPGYKAKGFGYNYGYP